ncbi:MAG: hypothetical protein PHS37_01190 [Candidatus Omnitrophica bacterium]|nr:hypothetical protein [Candidatus Omnitrophota bacterium]
MAEGGFVIKFDGKSQERCYACSFDYDEWSYEINEGKAMSLPRNIRKIEIVVEGDE